ncbi:hypothetical protein K466DRAFT_566922 [Polyporus arcularius HHB13444]|uniref:Uncharacterized protein n=1 Tax=Polyporus arcularius HHB13444 TaxID=1314778 RepID=A0A5C3P5J6_9APHY|nr:hypothetical protein K466DRAFT_566922 [Polyporus arcularius HHB13444]
MIRRLREPQGGYPNVNFDDHDSLVYGCDDTFITTMRTAKRKFEDESDPLIVRFALLDGLPPGKMGLNVMDLAQRAIAEVTNEKNVWVVPPRPTTAPVGDVCAIAWFVRGLTKAGAAKLLDMRLITTQLVTFFVFPHSVEPRLVLTLGGFWSNIGGQIEEMIETTFRGPEIYDILAQCAEVTPMFNGMETERAVNYLLETLEVKVSTLPDRLIFACAYLAFPGVEATTWRYLRNAIASVPFDNGYNSRGTTWSFRCGVCGANDHPEVLCVWPTLDGWLGPCPSVPMAQNEPPPQPGSSLVYRPRGNQTNIRGGGGNKQRKNRSGPYYPQGEGPQFSMGDGSGRRDNQGPGAAGPSSGGMRAF